MQLSKLLVTLATIVGVFSCAYVDPNIYQPTKNNDETAVEESIGIDQYDEDAVDDYMSGLKGVVQFLTATQTAESTVIMQGQMLLGLALGQMKTAKIEIDVWPKGARQKVWDVKGRRLQSYNDLVEEESARVLADPSFDPKLKELISSIKLITKESLLSD